MQTGNGDGLPPEMKNPGARAGAAGADHRKIVFQSEDYRMRSESAIALGEAIADCHPDDALQIIVAALFELMPAAPSVDVFLDAEQDATWWASIAAPQQLAAMLAAVLERLGDRAMHLVMRKRLLVRLFESLPPQDRVAFINRTDPQGQFLRKVAE